MDCDVVRRTTRSGRSVTQLVLLPDADISDPENESDSDADHDDCQSDDSDDVRGEASSSSDDDIPLSTYAKKQGTSQKPKAAKKSATASSKFVWKKTGKHPNVTVNCKAVFTEPPSDELQPIQYFKKYFTEDMISKIVEQTNVYAAQSGSNFLTDSTEIEQYIGILLKMGLVKMPRYTMYWSKELRYSPVADMMPRTRFFELNKFVHFNDNCTAVQNRNDPLYDRYHKVRPLLCMLRTACLMTEPERKMSVDEQMIPYKGKNSLRQYLPKKPKKWGFKVLARCGVSGMTYDFVMYDGQGPCVVESCGFQSGDFVVKLCETLPKQQEFTVYFDNWFTCFELQLLLKSWGIWSVGTVRSNRLRNCTLKSESELKKEGRGSVDSRYDSKNGISVVRWMDSSAVQLSSTHVAVEPVSTIRRWDRKQHKYVQIPCPAIVRDYNQHMGGVDLFDMLMALYKVDHKSNKWYRRVFFWALNVAVVNGWLLYKRHSQQKGTAVCEQLDLMKFTSSVSQSLCLDQKLPTTLAGKRRGRPTNSDTTPQSTANEKEVPSKKSRRVPEFVNQTSRFDNVGHFPEHAEPKQRCKLCGQYIRLKCMKCKCCLCVTKDRNCFVAYHTK